MASTDAAANSRARGILDWLGFARALAEAPIEPNNVEGATDLSAEELRDRRRRQMLLQVTSFMCSHRLEVNPSTLGFAYEAVTGADQALTTLIEERVVQRQPITGRWIEEFARGARFDDEARLVAALMARFQGTIAEFGETTHAACTATNAYNSALCEHVDDLDKIDQTQLLGEVNRLARSMLDRTRELKCAMEHTDAQTKALRRELKKARSEAACDHLTGLPNRRTFEAVLAREYAAALKTGKPLCVGFCDVDDFKRINDGHGRDAGDRVLREIALTLAAISDDHCHVARHGGQEFVVLFCGKTIDQATVMIDGAREALAERRLVNRVNDRPFGRLTFSAGIADVLAAGNPREALRQADNAMMLAKSQGRNRVFREDGTASTAAATR